MKKKSLAAAMAALLMCCLPLAADAAEPAVTPFDDVPAGHWAYDSLKVLADDGIVNGYKDGTFRGGNAITRYEMAAVVGKAYSAAKKNQDKLSPQGQEELDKLGREFYSELTSLGVRLKALEKYKSKAKLNGDLRLRYIGNPKNLATDETKQSGGYEYRVRVGYQAEIAKNLDFNARLHVDSSADNEYDGINEGDAPSDYSGDFYFDKGYLSWYKDKYQVDLGRMDFSLGQGAVAGGVQDGIYVTYRPDKNITMSAGYATMAPHVNGAGDDLVSMGQSVPIFQSNIGITSGATYITLASLKTLGSDYTYSASLPPNRTGGAWTDFESPFALDQYAIGFKTTLSDRLKFTGEYVTNQADGLKNSYTSTVDRDGYWLGLSYGNLDMNVPNTFQADLVYLNMGNWAIDSTFYPHGLWCSGGNYLGRDGEKGWGIQMQYMLGKNIDLAMDYFWVKPTNKDADFSKYRAPWQIALNYFF